MLNGSWGPSRTWGNARRRRAYGHTVRAQGEAGGAAPGCPAGRLHLAHGEPGTTGMTPAQGLGAWDREASSGGGLWCQVVVARRSEGKGGRESTEDTSRGFFRVPSAWRGSSSWWTGA